MKNKTINGLNTIWGFPKDISQEIITFLLLQIPVHNQEIPFLQLTSCCIAKILMGQSEYIIELSRSYDSMVDMRIKSLIPWKKVGLLKVLSSGFKWKYNDYYADFDNALHMSI